MTIVRRRAEAGWALRACLFVIPIGYLLLSVSTLLLLTSDSYEGIIRWYSAWRPDGFNAGSMTTNCFTPQWYMWLNAHRALLIVGLAAMLVGYLLYSRRVWGFLRDFCEETGGILRFMVDTYRQSSVRERVWLYILFACLLAYRLYMCLVIPLNTDELCSYLYFARQGFLVTLTSYPIPNNHILFNLLGACLAKLTVLSPKLVIRLPSVAGDLLLQYGIFCLFRRWDGFQRGIIVVAGTAFCYMISYYAAQGRGYQLQELCALVSGAGAWECFCGDGREERKGYGLFVLFSAAGIYINPTFFYYFTTVILMVLYFSWRRKETGVALSLGRAVLLTGVLTFVLYLPVLIAGKMGGTQTMHRGAAGWMVQQLPELVDSLRLIGYYGGPGIFLVCGLVMLLTSLYWKRVLTGRFYGVALVFFISAALSLGIWSLLVRDYPWARTICWLALALYMVFINACYDLWKSAFPRMRWVFWCFLLIRAAGSLRGLYWESSSVNSLDETKVYRELDSDLERLAVLHPQTWQITKSDDYYPMFLRLYLVEHGGQDRVVWDKKKAVGDIIFLPAIYESSFPKDGYTLWGTRGLTAEGKKMDIYVSKRLYHPGHFNKSAE